MDRASRHKEIKDAKYCDAIDRIEQLSTSDKVLCHSDFIHSKSIRVMEKKVNFLEHNLNVKNHANVTRFNSLQRFIVNNPIYDLHESHLKM